MNRCALLVGAMAVTAGIAAAPATALQLAPTTPAPAAPPQATAAMDGDVVLAALLAEIERSRDMRLQDLETPYFIQYGIDDSWSAGISSSYGAIEDSSERHTRMLNTSIRIGTPELDNTNFSGGGFSFTFFGGGFGQVPIEDDLVAIRDALWTATDAAYKSGLETLTKKRAYMEDKKLEDRPADFTPATPSQRLDPLARLDFDRARWEGRLAAISARFKQHLSVQNAIVRLGAGANNRYLVNTEGTRLRLATRSASLTVDVSMQAPDGMRLADRLKYLAETADELPSVETVVADVDALVLRLERLAAAPQLDHYSGPVLFEAPVAAAVFRQMLAAGLASRPDPVGTQRAGLDAGRTLEKKLGSRILPATFDVYDDPTVKRVGDVLLVGRYDFDDEGVAAQRVDLVTDGKLLGLCLSRAPTKKFSGSNGHGRRASFGSAQAGIGCLFVQCEKGLSDDELRQELVQAAIDAGLEFGIRVAAVKTSAGTDRPDFMSFMGSRGGGSKLTDPLYAYKVYVSDGHEELIRGCEFAPINDKELKHIVAAGQKPAVDNGGGASSFGGGVSSVTAPAVIFEELELSKIEQENDMLPYLPMPLARKG